MKRGPRKERRRYPRYPVDGIFGTLVPSAHVSLVNLSRHGIGFKLRDRLPVGATFLFEFQHSGRTANLEVEVAWCSRHRGGWGLFGGSDLGFCAGGRVRDIHRDSGHGGIWAGIQPDPEKLA